MNPARTKSLEAIENKMQGLDENSLRYLILKSAKDFKTSWIELGRALYTAYKDKVYKEWGFGTFDAYTSKEIGIKKNTAMKLLRSYYFLEKEEPGYLQKDYADNAEVSRVPSFESVNVLRMAKGKKILDESDYQSIKKDIFEKGKDASIVKKELTSLIRQRQELEPEEAHEKKRVATVKRFIGTLKSLKREMETSNLVSSSILKQAESLISKLEHEFA